MRKLLYTLLLLTITTGIYSQDISLTVISSGGTTASTSGGSVSFTAGEPVTGTISNGSYTMTQGFQQGSLIVNAVEENLPASCSIKAWPIPFANEINIECKLDTESEVTFEFTDINGKPVFRSVQSSAGKLFGADLSGLAAGSYMLKVMFNDGKYFKIIKVVKVN